MKMSRLLKSAIIIGSCLVSFACAHIDNGFGRSAVPARAGHVVSSFKIGSSYSPAPSFRFKPDSLNVTQERKYDLSVNSPTALEIGLGRGFAIGTQTGFSLSAGKSFPGYEEYKRSIILPDVKFYMQISVRQSKNTWLAFTPGYLKHWEVLQPQNRIRFDSVSQGFELPLTISFVKPYQDNRTIDSFTLRYSELRYTGDFFYLGKEPWSQYFYPEQQNMYVHRYALIYTFCHEDNKLQVQKLIDLGFELTYHKEKLMLAPVFGIRMSYDWAKLAEALHLLD